MSTTRPVMLSLCLIAAPALAEEQAQQPSQTLQTIHVTSHTSVADHDASLTSEGNQDYSVNATNTATRMVLSPRETPQSVSVISRQQMDDFGLDDVADVMQRTPGVTVRAQDTERLRFSARGFDITNFLYDGMPSMRSSTLGNQDAHADTFIYDRIEVLRGASGLLNGIGNPSATLNMVRKKPTREIAGQASVEGDSDGGYRGELDVGGPLAGNPHVRGRFVTAQQHGESFLDHYENRKQVYYGVLEIDLSAATMLTLGVDSMDYDPEGSTWGGIPLFYSDGSKTDLPRSFNPATDWSSWAQQARTAFINLEHRFDSGWYSRFAYTYQEDDYDAELASAGSGFPDPVDGSGMTLWVGRYQEEKKQDTFDLYANGPFTLFGRQHELIVGASHSRTDRHYTGQPALNFDTTVPSIFNWDGNRPKPAWGEENSVEDETLEQTGLYATARFKPIDRLALITGTRVVDWKRDLKGDSDWTGPVSEHYRENGQVVPYAGVVYDLTDQHSLYASYTSIFQPQTVRDRDNHVLEPEEGKSYEAGLKSEFNQGRVNTTVALFRIEQDNLAEATNETIIGGPANSVAYRSVDGAVTEGLELEASGELRPRWQLLAGYTHQRTEDRDGDEINTTAPQDLFRLSTQYRFDGALRKLTVGTGLSWQGDIYAVVQRPPSGNDVKFVQDSYTLVDAMARYQLTPALSVRLNASNLTNEKYYNNLGFYNGGYYGDGARYSAKLTYRW